MNIAAKIHVEVTLYKYLLAELDGRLIVGVVIMQRDWHLPLDDGCIIEDWYSPLVCAPIGCYSMKISTWECVDVLTNG